MHWSDLGSVAPTQLLGECDPGALGCRVTPMAVAAAAWPHCSATGSAAVLKIDRQSQPTLVIPQGALT